MQAAAPAGCVVGLNSNEAVLTACYATGDVKGDGERVGGTGGVAGRNSKDDYGSGILNACYWDGTVSGDTGIGYDMTGNSGATKVETPTTWETAMDAMNEALTSAGTDWRYATGSGDVPLALQRSN